MHIMTRLPVAWKNRLPFIVAAIVATLVVVGVVITVMTINKNRGGDTGMAGMNMGRHGVAQSHHTYSLDLMSRTSYPANQPTELMFDIRDENNNVLKNFDTVHTKLLHLIVVRKDRTNFQHVHPSFDKTSGMFTLSGFQFPTDGQYRIFAEFTPPDSQMDDMGMKLAAVPFKDVTVGAGNYTPQPIGDDTLTSDTNGFTTTIAPVLGDSPNPQAYANIPIMLGVTISKDGALYKNLQDYLGALGHMIVLGPNLEYVHAHAAEESTANQTGTVTFTVKVPTSGQYKLYVQTQANNQVNTTDYTYSFKSFTPAKQAY